MEPGKEGGTWLGISMKGKAAVILNLVNKDPLYSSKKGRGFLISDFITSSDSIESYLNELHQRNINEQPYNPYCLVLLDLKYVNEFSYNSSNNVFYMSLNMYFVFV